MLRTHNCAELRESDTNKIVCLSGWVDSSRDHGGIMFVDLRDREGLTQVVFDPQNESLKKQFSKLKIESVISVSGVVKERVSDTVNSDLDTGKIEIHANEVFVHNVSDTPPFPLSTSSDIVSEELRMRYRYLDLRRKNNIDMLKIRHKTTRYIRKFLDDNNFIEIETPILFKSTPEGAREFLVPSRLNPGNFYALPQSPQQYKQMLMVAGVEKYYQIARCFRDEDLRSDRQPEFTQLDIELSFVNRELMYGVIESLMNFIWKSVLGLEIEKAFTRISYNEAMNRFGVDKPDMRFDFELVDCNHIFKDTEFKVFGNVISNNGFIKAINAKGLSNITQGELKQLEESARTLGAKGLAYIKCDNDEWKSPILKFLSDSEKDSLKSILKIESGDIVFFSAGDWENACSVLGRIRLDVADLMIKRGLLNLSVNDFRFLWVIDFPLLTYDGESKRYVSSHHPFTSPISEDVDLLKTDPLKVRGQHYDLVVNGVELGGGSIRIHNPDMQKMIFKEVLGLDSQLIEDRFGYMLEAFKYGAPPHGGIAFGLDRMVAILSSKENIREVIAFPKNQKGQELMTQSPSCVTKKQLNDVSVSILEKEGN